MPRRAEITPRVLPADSAPLLDARQPGHQPGHGRRQEVDRRADRLRRALDKVEERSGRPALEVLEQAIKSVTPSLEVRSRRVGGANYQVPIEVPARRARTLAVRWIVTFARQRREREMVERLAAEILDAINQQGGAFKRKDDMYRMAQANKAFAHYRW